MKKLISCALIITVMISFYSCRDEKKEIFTPEPIVQTSIEKIPKDIIEGNVVVFETKRPFILIPDNGFEALLVVSDIDKDNQINGKVALEDIEKLDSLIIAPSLVANKYNKKNYEMVFKRYPKADFIIEQGIAAKNLKGIEYFKNLKYLNCTGNLLDSLSLSKNSSLIHIIYYRSPIKYLDISGCKNLKILDMGPGANWMSFPTLLEKVDISKNLLLEEYRLCSYAEKIDFSKNLNLKIVDVRFNYALKDLDLSQLSKLNSFLATNCRQMFKVCLSEQAIAKIDTTTYEQIDGWSRPIWQKDYWTVWGKCK